jgi:PadR family transcriptional regulator PadR
MADQLVDPWPGEWLRGLMEVCALRAIEHGPTYGYAIAASLEAAGLGPIKGGTLYPLLARLERAGWVSTHWGAGDGGPGRKFYELTDPGRAHLAQTSAQWADFSQAIAAWLGTRAPANPTTIRRQT